MFYFKQFALKQDRCAMKVGTDGVLLGAWAPVDHNPSSVLDIGAGTGLLSLMIAQRCSYSTQIDAVEIDENAFEQAVDNFESSPWSDRLFCYHAALSEFVEEIEQEYDLIISNPPFYAEAYKTENQLRDIARFQDAMPFEELLYAVAYFLSEQGVFSTIIPFSQEKRFLEIAAHLELYPFKITHVKGTKEAVIKRSLLAFSREKKETPAIEILLLEVERHQYTAAYNEIVKDFYLKK